GGSCAPGGRGAIVAVSLGQNGGRLVAFAAKNEPLTIRECSPRKMIVTLPAKSGELTEALCFSPNEKTLAWAHTGGHLRLYDVARKSVVDEMQAHDEPITALAFSPDEATLVTTARSGLIKL